jgi:hypothetical protein
LLLLLLLHEYTLLLLLHDHRLDLLIEINLIWLLRNLGWLRWSLVDESLSQLFLRLAHLVVHQRLVLYFGVVLLLHH